MGLGQNRSETAGFDCTAGHGCGSRSASPYAGVTTNALAPNRMSADERLKEVSQLLAAAVLRRRVSGGRH